MGLWSLASAEVQGSIHKKMGLPCQDKTVCIERDKVRVIGLADGAGSAKMSQYGAEEVIKQVCNFLIDHFDELRAEDNDAIKRAVSDVVRETLTDLAERLECDVKDLSSTLLAVAVKKQRYIALHIGDGVIGCYLRDKLVTLSKPDNGEFAHLTWFTTTTELEKVVRIYQGDAAPISGFILMSDGVEPSLYDGQNNQLADAVINLFYSNAKYCKREMTDMLEESLRDVVAQRTHDDCAIALLSRTRYKNYAEYAKYRKKVAKRNKMAKNAR